MILETIQEELFSRVNSDSTLQTLLGGSGRFFHSLQPIEPQIGSVRYYMTVGIPGSIQGDNMQSEDQYYSFQIFADNANAIVKQLRALLDRYRLNETTDAGAAIVLLDWVGPDEFDEGLKCAKKEMRFRVIVLPKPLGPV